MVGKQANSFGCKDIISNWMSKPGPARQVEDVEIVDAMKKWMSRHDEPCVRADEVSKLVDLGTQQCRDRLMLLHDEGVVEFKKSGSGKVWWLS